MTYLANDAGGALLVIVPLIAGLYFLPTICALVRKVPNVGSVAVINIFLGWTFIGWVIALAMAFRSANPSVHVNVHNQQPYQQPYQQPGGWPGGQPQQQPQQPQQPPDRY
jgi:hypothetical protein